MLFYATIIQKKVLIMRIYDGKHMDKTDEKSDEYIKINSAGIQNLSSSCTVIRDPCTVLRS